MQHGNKERHVYVEVQLQAHKVVVGVRYTCEWRLEKVEVMAKAQLRDGSVLGVESRYARHVGKRQLG